MYIHLRDIRIGFFLQVSDEGDERNTVKELINCTRPRALSRYQAEAAHIYSICLSIYVSICIEYILEFWRSQCLSLFLSSRSIDMTLVFSLLFLSAIRSLWLSPQYPLPPYYLGLLVIFRFSPPLNTTRLIRTQMECMCTQSLLQCPRTFLMTCLLDLLAEMLLCLFLLSVSL